MSDNGENMAQLLTAETDFGLSLLRQHDLTESVVFSPISIALALVLVHTAANGETKNQIKEALAKGATDEQLIQHYQNISAVLLSAEKGTHVKLANRIFTNNQFDIKQDYLDTIQKLYNAAAEKLDFANQQASADAVNNFVKENTADHIKEIIKPTAFSGDLVAVIANALYFEAIWQKKFKDHQSLDSDFFKTADDKRTIKFLRAREVHRLFSENGDWQVLQLPYKDETYRYNVFLPSKRFGLQEALKTLDANTIQSLVSNTSEVFLNIQIPKMKIESELPLECGLKKLGITTAFTEAADLTNLAENIYVSKVTHKAIIEVDESGTVAAAASTVELMTKSAMFSINEPREFLADHPFLFIITKDGHPLFAGVHN
ncbi:unnamed protein product [Caenorhabditis bovis]|uniref:Serpin domain-containing protein n=1 Tax=Caenorhabditis bovis TaxID=2654633 RepID=A0A8S1EA00_9PELO|nr:unnamed protein product [Caenorhabditis bovis]